MLAAEGLPDSATLASLGCGNPTAVAALAAGETVLDLGSGAGLDVFMSARRVGPKGKVYGLDMTDEMLALANRNREELGADNVEFIKGDIEDISLPDGSVDVIISKLRHQPLRRQITSLPRGASGPTEGGTVRRHRRHNDP